VAERRCDWIIKHVFDSGWSAVVEEPRASAVTLWSSWTPGPELAAALAASEPAQPRPVDPWRRAV
jgi:hypothetical protein